MKQSGLLSRCISIVLQLFAGWHEICVPAIYMQLSLVLQLFSGYGGTCVPILCKMEAAIVASCQVYEDTDGIIGPGSRVIHGDYSTDVGVRWDAANTTALIAFRGSQVRLINSCNP